MNNKLAPHMWLGLYEILAAIGKALKATLVEGPQHLP